MFSINVQLGTIFPTVPNYKNFVGGSFSHHLLQDVPEFGSYRHIRVSFEAVTELRLKSNKGYEQANFQ